MISSDSVWFWRLCPILNGFVRTLAKRSCAVCTALLESCLHPAMQQITKCHLYKIHIITMAICHSQTSPIGQASWIPWKAGDFLLKYYILIFFVHTVLMWSFIAQTIDDYQRPWCKAGLRPLQACESSCMNACMPTCLAIYTSFFIYHAFLEVHCLHNGGRLRRNRRRGKNIKWMKKNQKQTVQNRAFHAWTNYYKKILFCFLICMHAWVCLLEALI